MKENHNAKPEQGLKTLPLRFGLLTLLAGTGLAVSMSANAAPPPANAVIGNQAVAEYLDASGAKQTTLSNLVETTVLPIGVFELEPPVTKSILAGQTAYMAHILTNRGNAADKFTLSFAANNASTGVPTSIKVYADANADGMPDDLGNPFCTVNPSTYATSGSCKTPLVAGGDSAFNFVVAVQSASNHTGAPWEEYKLTATADQIPIGITYSAPTRFVDDTVNITTGPIFDVTKSINIPGGPASAPGCTVANYTTASGCKTATYTLTYTNRGSAAGAVQIQDIIGQNATVGMAYIPGTAKWSNSATALTDAAIPATAPALGTEDASDATGAKVYYERFDTSATVKTLNTFVTGVKPNATASISFEVLVLPTAAAGTSTTTNTAQFGTVPTGTDPSPNPSAPPESSNPSPYIVGLGQQFNVVANNNTTSSTDHTDDSLAAGVNLVLGGKIDDAGAVTTTAAAGQAVFFENVIWNTGDGEDTFDMRIISNITNPFPAGTSFQLFKTDGINPLLDTTGDGVPDTGPIAAGDKYVVKLKVIIPLNACTNGCPTGPFTVQKTATSNGDKTKINNVFDRLATITAGSVDLKNTATTDLPTGVTATIDAGLGANLAPFTGSIDQTVITAKAGVSPGSTQYFDLPVYNTGSSADSYALTYHVAATKLGNISAFIEGTLPAGWKITFRKNTTAVVDTLGTAVCSATTAGAAITSTDLIKAGGLQHVCAEVTTAANAQTLSYLHFKAQSQASGARDVKIDSIAFASTGSLSLIPNNTGQVYPGGTVVYPHTLSATVSACAGVALGAKMDGGQIGLGWSAKVYNDVNNNGVIDTGAGGDTYLGAADATGTPFTVAASLAKGTPVNLLVQVFAPNGAAVGVTNLVDLTATGDCNPAAGVQTSTATANDLTTVIIGQLRLYKKQALDTACDGETTYAVADIQAKPGECIAYEIAAVNEGAADVKNLIINDTTPVFTTSHIVPPGACVGGSNPAIVQPGAGATGAVKCTWPATEALKPGNQVYMRFRVKINQ